MYDNKIEMLIADCNTIQIDPKSRVVKISIETKRTHSETKSVLTVLMWPPFSCCKSKRAVRLIKDKADVFCLRQNS